MLIFSPCLNILLGFIEMHELFFKDEVKQLDVTLMSTVHSNNHSYAFSVIFV